MVSGASRLIAGLVQLVLLAFGLAAGALLVGVGPDYLLESTTVVVKAPWAPWAGAVVFALGVALHFSAPRDSIGWLLLVVLVAFAAQRAAAVVFGSDISGFFGTLVATPLAYLVQLRFKGPPVAVTFLPSFWMLVPGSLGLLSVTRMLSDRTEGMDGMITVVFAVVSIALGTLVGASFYRWATEKFGWWQLQIGRPGRTSAARTGNAERGETRLRLLVRRKRARDLAGAFGVAHDQPEQQPRLEAGEIARRHHAALDEVDLAAGIAVGLREDGPGHRAAREHDRHLAPRASPTIGATSACTWPAPMPSITAPA